MALTKVIGAGLGEVKGASSADLTIDAPTDNATLTLKAGSSDSGAEGAFAVFIQNTTNKWQMGMNTDNSFRLYSYGASAEVLNMDSTGAMTKQLQPAFSVNLGGTNSSTLATDGSALTLSFNTERFDTNADFASNTFTAPVTGKYLLAVQLRINNMDTAANYYIPTILTSNQAYRTLINPKFSSDISYIGMTTTIVADMDASDTATVTIQQSGGSAQSVVEGTADYTYFSGYLLG